MKKFLLFLAAAMLFMACEKKAEAPEANFSYKFKPLSVVIMDYSTGKSVTYDFGDQSTPVTISPGETITHKYNQTGRYVIKAVARNSDGDINELHSDITISAPKIYVSGMEFVRIIDEDEYFKFKLNDDGPYLIKTWIETDWLSRILYSSILPTKIRLEYPTLLENPTKHKYYTLYVYHSKTASGDGTQRLKQNITIDELLKYPDYIEKHNDADDTVVRLLLEYR